MYTMDVGEAGWEHVYPGVRRWTANVQRMTLTFYRFAPGATFPLHHHAQEQIAVVLRGWVVFHNAATRVTCRPRQVMVIPPDEPHAAMAGDEGADVASIVAPARRGADDVVVGEPR